MSWNSSGWEQNNTQFYTNYENVLFEVASLPKTNKIKKLTLSLFWRIFTFLESEFVLLQYVFLRPTISDLKRVFCMHFGNSNSVGTA